MASGETARRRLPLLRSEVQFASPAVLDDRGHGYGSSLIPSLGYGSIYAAQMRTRRPLLLPHKAMFPETKGTLSLDPDPAKGVLSLLASRIFFHNISPSMRPSAISPAALGRAWRLHRAQLQKGRGPHRGRPPHAVALPATCLTTLARIAPLPLPASRPGAVCGKSA